VEELKRLLADERLKWTHWLDEENARIERGKELIESALQRKTEAETIIGQIDRALELLP